MRKCAGAVVLFFLLAGMVPATPLIARGATVLKPLHFIGYGIVGYSKTAKSYDWQAKEYKGLADSLSTATFSAEVMAGLSPLRNLEVLLTAPLVVKSEGDLSSAGLGDMSLQLRYGMLSGAWPVKLTLAGALALPTSAKDALVKLGDRTTDVGLGAAAQTMKIGPLVAHARAAYWLKGKSNDATQLGNMLEYVVFPDFALGKKASAFVTLSGVVKAQTRDKGEAKPNTESSAHYLGGGFTWNPLGPLWFKPKFALPFDAASKGGKLPDFTVGLDLWAVVP